MGLAGVRPATPPLISTTAVWASTSPNTLDVAVAGGNVVWTFPTTKAARQQVLQRVQEASATLVCLEATGGLEQPLLDPLHENGIDVAVVNPQPIRDFAHATGQFAKTDAIDARTIAGFGQVMQPRITPPQTPTARKLPALTARRHQPDREPV